MTATPPIPIMLGLSGGVDSSVAAHLLKAQGFDVTAVFMKNWEEDDTEGFCAAAEEIQDAQAVCTHLSLPFQTVNFADQYYEKVFQHFLSEYEAGRTPNPDILCNREIKFRAFLDYALARGAHKIATGHYVQTRVENGKTLLIKAADANKDQTYFLWALSQDQVAKALFPVGHLVKNEVRALAEKIGLPNFAKKDSTGVCFIGERRFKPFLNRFLSAKIGDIYEVGTNQKLGQHDGLIHYTLGQRQGLQIGGQRAKSGEPWFVANKDIKNNILWVAQGQDHPALFTPRLMADSLNFISGEAPGSQFKAQAKVRYRQQEVACTVTLMGDWAEVVFDEPQRAVTPGQSIVFYQGDVCLGGGVINTLPSV